MELREEHIKAHGSLRGHQQEILVAMQEMRIRVGICSSVPHEKRLWLPKVQSEEQNQKIRAISYFSK